MACMPRARSAAEGARPGSTSHCTRTPLTSAWCSEPIGDAGYAAGPGGNGTGTAVVAAYVLAGELAAASGDYRAAFARYEHLLRGYVARGQKQALGGRDFLAPATEKKIRQCDRFFRMLPYLPTKGLIRCLSTRTATAIKLPGYP
jgi:2-polyprenyl-6-methoxyphenol hydroxylase-like FAD-dependent oxidoreductase